jgi:Holliday junction resolvase RusA-like endonuclease
MHEASRLVVLGPPRTKKNHSRIVRAGRKFRLLPSEAHDVWLGAALPQLRLQWRREPLTCPVGVRAVFYRERSAGDLVNYMQALADALERAGVVEDDRQILSWDGSRLAKDARHPRIELEIAPLDEAQP